MMWTRRIGTGGTPTIRLGPPTFERRSSQLSFRLPGQAVEVRHLDRKWSEVWVPKAGWVRFRRHRSIDGVVRSATFTFTPATGWTVSFGIAAKTIHAPPNAKPGCGVDFGVACSAFVSTEDAPRMKPSSLTPGEGRPPPRVRAAQGPPDRVGQQTQRRPLL